MPAKRLASKTASGRIASKPNSRNGSITAKKSPTRYASPANDSEYSDNDADTIQPQAKRRKTGNASKEEAARLHQRLFANSASLGPREPTSSLPGRAHSIDYHRPLLLHPASGRTGQDSLLNWFDSVSSARSMPWRKAWINPDSYSDPKDLRDALERRAYEVWISEIMLQQTRVAVVIDYWNNWMAKWPSIHDLAAADPEDVLAAWRGLGYYSRATRVHEAAKKVVQDPKRGGLLPEDARMLEAEVPGVGRYTAGAISSIVFGRPEPMVDGNVLRVLSRQLGLLGNVKADKSVIDTLWAAADALVKDVTWGQTDDSDTPEDRPKNDRPGRWGQALMELGSTVCTPKPNCASCPITATCRVYQEGHAFATKKSSKLTTNGSINDIEDACHLCEPLENVDDDEPEPKKPAPVSKQSTLASFAFTRQTTSKATPKAQGTEAQPKPNIEAIANHAKKFPLKVAKKPVREEETLVCAIRRDDGTYLIRRRPAKGLLAGLWEFPSQDVDPSEAQNPKARKDLATSFVAKLVGGGKDGQVKHVGDLGSVPWLFSHIRLTMHVHLFHVHESGEEPRGTEEQPVRWSEDVDQESMGTGMRKCWSLVKNSED